MHRAVGMRLSAIPTARLLSRRVTFRYDGGTTSTRYSDASPSSTQFQLMSSEYSNWSSCDRLNFSKRRPNGQRTNIRRISSTAPAWKGRRGGASALMPKRSFPVRRKVPGEGKKKKPKVHGAPMSKIRRLQRLDEESKQQFEAIKAISPEDHARIQKLAEDFVNSPLGQDEVGLNDYLRLKDPDTMMLNLGMTLSGDAAGKASLPDGGQTPALPSPPPTRPQPHEQNHAADSHEPNSTPRAEPWMPTLPESADQPYPLELTPSAGPSPISEPGYPGMPTLPVLDSTGTTTDFNLLLRTLAAHHRYAEARHTVVPEMRRRGIEMDVRSYTSLLVGAGMQKDLAAVEEVWSEMIKSGVRPDERAWSFLIHSYTKAGRMKKALKVGQEMRNAGHPWDVVTYTSLITGYTMRRDYSNAWRTWKDMIIWGNKPDERAYRAMMELCAETRQYERAMTFLNEMDMEDHRITRGTIIALLRAAATAPQWIRAYGSIVDDLAERFVGSGLPPDEEIYRALMLAYGSGGDADKVLQCIEEAHVLKGHTVDLVGDGTPKLSWQTYCVALEALGKCMSVGRHRGTRPRFGVLAGQDALIMDITSLEVPEEDANRVRQMQMAAIEWDEEGEEALRKGYKKGKRSEFMGVTTPKDIIGDDDFERAIEDEYARVMMKAKDLKKQEERERLIELGFDPEADDKVAKTRPRILPDPRHKQRLEAPLPQWLSKPNVAPPSGIEGDEAAARGQPPTPLGIADGLVQMNAAHQKQQGLRPTAPAAEEWDEDSWRDIEEFSRDDSMSSSVVAKGDRGSEWIVKDSWDEDDDGEDKEELSEEFEPGVVQRGVDKRGKGDGALGGRLSMFDVLNQTRFDEMSSREKAGQQGDQSKPDKLVFPPNVEDIMEEMRAMAQQDLDRRADRHRHGKGAAGVEEGEGSDEEWEEDDWEGEENAEGGAYVGQEWTEDSEAEGHATEIDAAAVDGPEAQAHASLQDIIAESLTLTEGVERSEDDASDVADDGDMFDGLSEASDTAAGSRLLDQFEQREVELEQLQPEQQEEEEEESEEMYEDWEPVMHQNMKDRTEALMEVVSILEVDAMEAARRADSSAGRMGEGAEAGQAVRGTLLARLKSLTEARRCTQAIRFIEEEYPKEGAKLDNRAAFQIVDMYVNTRGVGLAQVFERKCRDVYGLPPDRRMLTTILNARAKRAYAQQDQIPQLTEILDLLQHHKIKPHENELQFVRHLVDRGRFNHSSLPADPNFHVKRMKLAAKKSKPVNKSFFKVMSKIKNAKYIGGTGRGKSRIE